jgi:predicted amino acid-binding ACT domain protein
MPSEIGALAQLSRIAADNGINILAISATVQGRDIVFRLTADDNLRMLEPFNA